MTITLPRSPRSGEAEGPNQDPTRTDPRRACAARGPRIARVPIGLLIPFLVLFALFFLFPFVYAFGLSLFVEKGSELAFVGLQNYAVAWSDNAFWSAFLRVVWFGVVFVALMLVVALGLALLLDSPFARSRTLYRLLYFLPYAVPGVIAALMWGFLYSPELNQLIAPLAVFNGGQPVDILNQQTLLYAIVNMVLWGGAGYTMTIYVASLTSIPIELYEAARIDGANEWQIAWRIKIPMIRSTVIMTLVLTIIGALQLFSEPFVLSSMIAVPWNYTPNMEIFNMAFSYGNFTYSATLSIVLAAVTFVLSMLFMIATAERTRRRKAIPGAEDAPSGVNPTSNLELHNAPRHTEESA